MIGYFPLPVLLAAVATTTTSYDACTGGHLANPVYASNATAMEFASGDSPLPSGGCGPPACAYLLNFSCLSVLRRFSLQPLDRSFRLSFSRMGLVLI